MKRFALVLAVVCAALAAPAVALDHFNNFSLSGNASPGAFPNTPLGAANSLEATMGYTLDAHDTAQVTVSMTGVAYVAKPEMISKGVGVVKVRFSALCSPATPATQAVHEVVLKMWDAAKNEIVSARSAQNVSLTFTCPATAVGSAPKPDLVITSFGLESWGSGCANGDTLFTFSVGVKNQGAGTWPAGGNRPPLVVRDKHPASADNFATGIAIEPPLAPGASRVFHVPVVQSAQVAAHLKAETPHPFQAFVNENHAVDESDFGNNAGPGPVTWQGIKVIQVGVPEACLKTPKLPPPAGAGSVTGRVAPPAPTPTLVPIR